MIKEVPKTGEEFGKKKTSELCGSSPVLILPISPAGKTREERTENRRERVES